MSNLDPTMQKIIDAFDPLGMIGKPTPPPTREEIWTKLLAIGTAIEAAQNSLRESGEILNRVQTRLAYDARADTATE